MEEQAEKSEECGNELKAGSGVRFAPLPDSENYIKKLESRLFKVKGFNKDLTSKDMISVLEKAREDFMHHLVSDSSRFSMLHSSDKEVSVSFIERKLFPEKNGVTYEELQHLLESDVLAKVNAESSAETLNDGSIDR